MVVCNQNWWRRTSGGQWPSRHLGSWNLLSSLKWPSYATIHMSPRLQTWPGFNWTMWGIRGLSTTTALLSIMQEWPRLLDQNNEICSVFFDLQKIFDSEPYKLLWKRLEGSSSVPQVGTQLHHTQLYPSQNCMQLLWFRIWSMELKYRTCT